MKVKWKVGQRKKIKLLKGLETRSHKKWGEELEMSEREKRKLRSPVNQFSRWRKTYPMEVKDNGFFSFQRGRSKVYKESKQDDKFQLTLNKNFPIELSKHEKCFPREWWVLCCQKYYSTGYIAFPGKGFKYLVVDWSRLPARSLVISGILWVLLPFYRWKKSLVPTEGLAGELNDWKVIKPGLETGF